MDPLRIAADGLAATVRRMPSRARRILVAGPAGSPVIAGILWAMCREVDRERAGGIDAVVSWSFTREGGEPECWYQTIRDGRIELTRRPPSPPRLAMTTDRLALLELATGLATGPQLYVTGRMRIDGEMALAQRLTTLFRIPGGRSP